MGKLDVSEAVDERLAQVGQLVQQRVVLLLDHLVLLLDGLQVGLHGGDLEEEEVSTLPAAFQIKSLPIK